MTTNLDQLTPAQLRRVDAMLFEKIVGARKTNISTYRSLGPDPRYPMESRNEFHKVIDAWEQGYEVYTLEEIGNAKLVSHYTTDPAAALGLLETYCDREGIAYRIIGYRDSKVVRLSDWLERRSPELSKAICAAIGAAEGLKLGEVTCADG